MVSFRIVIPDSIRSGLIPSFRKFARRFPTKNRNTRFSGSLRLEDPKLIPEGIAFDPKSNRFFIGSIAERKIVVTDGKDEARDFSKPFDKLDGVLGLRIDPGARSALCNRHEWLGRQRQEGASQRDHSL